MSIIHGGIFGEPRGKTGGLVFSSARTIAGKVNTIRSLVIPANPKTPDQMANRNMFSSALFIVKALGPQIYQYDWNRSTGALPGFQSLMSKFKLKLDTSLALDPLDDTLLGNLHFPNTFTVTSPSAHTVKFDWTDELGANGLADDIFKAILIPVAEEDRIKTSAIIVDVTAERSDKTLSITTPTGITDYIYIGYFEQNTPPNPHIFSIAKSEGITVL